MKITNALILSICISLLAAIAGCPQQKSGPYRISGDVSKVEFEDLNPYKVSPSLVIEPDKSDKYPWSGGKGLILSSPKNNEYVMYQIFVDDDTPRNIKFYGFKNSDYGRYRIAINDRPTGKLIEFNGYKGSVVDGFDFGTFAPKNGVIKVIFALVGSKIKYKGANFGAAFDYMVLTKVPSEQQ